MTYRDFTNKIRPLQYHSLHEYIDSNEDGIISHNAPRHYLNPRTSYLNDVVINYLCEIEFL